MKIIKNILVSITKTKSKTSSMVVTIKKLKKIIQCGFSVKFYLFFFSRKLQITKRNSLIDLVPSNIAFTDSHKLYIIYIYIFDVNNTTVAFPTVACSKITSYGNINGSAHCRKPMDSASIQL